MRILDPERNKTENLWKRLAGSSNMPIIMVSAAICSTNILRYDGGSKIVGIVMLSLIILISLGSSLSHKKIVQELKNRCGEESSNTNLEPISGSQQTS